MPTHQPKYEIIYNGKNITADMLPYVTALTYADKSNGEADELEVLMEDKDGLWKSDWFPGKGDTISAKIIDVTGTLDCGVFTIDEIVGEGSTSGDVITIKAIAAGVNKKLRTAGSYAHEQKSLREIANKIASKHGLKVEGDIKEVRIGRVTQYRETDLNFLKRLAYEYGYTFNVRDSRLIFTSVFELETKASALQIHRTELTAWNITSKVSGTFKDAKIAHHSPAKKKAITHQQTETTAAFTATKADTLELRCRAENQQQAELKTKVALYRANSLQQEGNFEMPGNVLVLAGNNCTLVGIGMFSGLYYLGTSTHTVDKGGGYTTTGEVKRVGLVNKSQQKQDKAK